jgi:cell division septal protein FtsQ
MEAESHPGTSSTWISACRSDLRRGELGDVARTAVSASPALRLVPSGRSLAVGFGLLGVALALYAGARQTAVFDVHDVEVGSVPPAQARVVERELAGLEGTSLLQIDQEAIQRRLEKLPHVHLLGYDRAFPNGLRVEVSVERPVAVLRRGSDRWLVSAEGRVLRPLRQRLRRPLPVVWIERSVEPEVGTILRAAEPARAVRTLAEVRAADPALGRQVWYVKVGEAGTTTAVLRDRFEIRLGTADDLAVKLAVARRVLFTLRREGDVAADLDVSVAERPVVGETLNSQVEPER